MRGWLLACLLLASPLGEALEVLQFDTGNPAATPESIVRGEWDAQFVLPADGTLRTHHDFWLKFPSVAAGSAAALVLQATRQTRADAFILQAGSALPVAAIARLPGFLGLSDNIYPIPEQLRAGEPLYFHVVTGAGSPQPLSFHLASVDEVLAQGAGRTRTIAFAFGALTSVSLAALLIWFVLRDRLFILYASMFLLQALYVAYLSGQGFDWPWLRVALPLGSFAWNVPAALSGSVACLFTREIADLRRFWPRVHAVFGWLSGAFVLLGCANVAKLFGYGTLVNALGNVMFLGVAAFTAVVCFVSWRRGNRPAGWFLLAWALLEGFTIAAAMVFLLTSKAPERMLFEGLPLSMVAAAVLIALGVADRLRAQRRALTEAQHRAQTDPLTGVLNRSSLRESLQSACLRAQTRGMPISLLFIDLDHFKQINDSFGHPAGDACLRAIIAPIHAELRQSDVIGRYGGEEFVVILSSADAAAAVPIAQRILERVAAVQVEGFGATIRLTCSIGVASSDTLGVWGEHLVAHADTAVYAAKRAGRNRLFVAQPAVT